MRVLVFLLLAVPLGAEVETIYIVPGSHLDIGFTDTPSRVREKRIETLDQAIEAAKADPDFHLALGGGWPEMFTEKQTLDHARESAAIFARAVELALGAEALDSVPSEPQARPVSNSVPEEWDRIIADRDRPARLRAGRLWLSPFVVEVSLSFRVEGCK